MKFKVKNIDDQKRKGKKLIVKGNKLIGPSLFTSSSDSDFPALLFRISGGSLVILLISLI